MRKGSIFFILLIGVLLASHAHEAIGIPSQVDRVFYLTSGGPVTPNVPGTLSPARPIGPPCSTCVANITTSSIGFGIPGPLATPGLTVQGPVTVSLLVGYELNQTARPYLQAAFSYHFPGASSWTNTNSTQQVPNLGVNNVTFNLPVQSAPLPEGSSIAIEVSVTATPKNSSIELFWGSSSSRSFVEIPMSAYQTLSPANTLTIQDTNQNHSPFYLNSQYNVLTVKVDVLSALGFSDLRRVNMTILDSHSQPVRGATNESMQGPQTGPCPCAYIGSWQYSTNSTQGQYEVSINIIDIQGSIAYASPPSASTFLLVPPGYVPFPYNLIPYLIVGGIGASGGVAGAVVYRRRRGKSYLVPFDYFNNLTGGELSGGTSVMVEGNTGSGKTRLLEQLMGEDLKKSRPCVFVSAGDFPDSIRSSMRTIGVDVTGYEQKGLLTFVDGYSAEAGQESREKISIPSLGDLTTLGIKLTSALPTPSFKGGSLFFDSLTSLASKARAESIVSFVQSVSAKVKGLGGKAFFSIGSGIDPAVQRQIADMTDCIVQMEAFEESGARKRRLRIAKFRARKHQEGWSLFTIEDGRGIIFYSKRPTQ